MTHFVADGVDGVDDVLFGGVSFEVELRVDLSAEDGDTNLCFVLALKKPPHVVDFCDVSSSFVLGERFTNVSDAVAVDDVDDKLFDDFEVCVSDRTARVKDEEEVDTVALRTSGLQLFTHANELGSVATRSVILLPEVALTFDVTRNVNVLRLK